MKDFLKKYGTWFLLILITLLGLYLRLKYIDRPDGLWFDEAFSYHIAIHKFPLGIMEALYKGDFHAPFYFFLLHFWIKLFGNADVTLRVFSVLIGTVSIPAIYLLGKEAVDKKVGLLAAALLSINAFHIYQSQEIRFYVLSALFIILSSLFLVKFLNDRETSNLVGIVIFNLLLCVTLSFGVFFAFFQGIAALVYFYIKDRESFKRYLISQIIIFACYLFYIPFIFHQYMYTQTSITKPFDWYKVNHKLILYAFTHWFSPYGLNYQNAFFLTLSKGLGWDFLYCFALPFLYLGGSIIKGIKFSNHKIGLITLSFIFYCSFQIIMAKLGKTAFIERYTIPVLPLAIVSLSYWILSFKNKFFKIFVVLVLILTPLYYEFFNSSYTRSTRLPGFNHIQGFLSYFNISKNDLMLMPLGGEVFYKYNPIKIIPINDIDIFFIYQPYKLRLVFDEQTAAHINKKNIGEYTKKYCANLEPNEPNRINYNKEISKLSKGRYFVIASLDELGDTNLMRKYFNRIETDQEYYKNGPKMGLIIQKIEFDYYNLAKNDPKMEFLGSGKKHNWNVFIFKKIK